MGKRFQKIHHQRDCTKGKVIHEKMFTKISHWEMYMKTTIGNHYISLKTAKIKTIPDNKMQSVNKNVEQLEPLCW